MFFNYNKLHAGQRSPCLDCPDRHPRCHGQCEKYQTFKAEVAKRRDGRNSEAQTNQYFCEVKADTVEKMRKKGKRK